MVSAPFTVAGVARAYGPRDDLGSAGRRGLLLDGSAVINGLRSVATAFGL